MTTDIVTIERDLQELWKNNTAEAAAAGHSTTRALTLNLLARASSADEADAMGAVIQELTASHPCRAVVLIDQPATGEPQLEAWVQANCLLPAPGAPQVCGEQITISSRGGRAGQVASLMLPLLVPDLPVVLWMAGDQPFGHRLLGKLRGVLDRLIVDSAGFADPIRDLVTMAAFDAGDTPGPGAGPDSPALSDLNWARLTPWRELTAQFFDTRPFLPHLHRLDHVEIDYVAAGDGGLLRALMLAGWLASSLGWDLVDGGVSRAGEEISLRMVRPGVGAASGDTRPVTISLRPAPFDNNALVGLSALHMRAVDHVLADFSVEHTDSPTCARTVAQADGHPTVSRLARVERAGAADLLAAELRLLSRDRTFSAALQAAAGFARGIIVP
ncbi:glucose-6-phosphate dehydrogenase assembly protein OpcA [Oscillochloris sp. ZM17-4]|uniref:glucose-6-phosphate dehydrogenase assembly protein OpcA n=1 Tax=Oscillochloris sp. ZM17-4 TaxID=2866714 RepID=UPI001C73832B|nr:glucose-6-phosphate dehydrogenase assembly protein OpcA [Oscillochloris sp. ZM17-4]MBX0328986.1 glucose-6-phosphate dehydrogenase assembly protein OpcA [Oscillochloris sp. ZM17-4]